MNQEYLVCNVYIVVFFAWACQKVIIPIFNGQQIKIKKNVKKYY